MDDRMTIFRGRGTAAGTILSALILLSLIGLVHVGLLRGFHPLLLPEARLGFAALIVLSFGLIATTRLAAAVRQAKASRSRWVGVRDDGLEWTDGRRDVRVAWEEIEEVRVNFLRLQERVVSYVTATTKSGERFSLSHHFQGRVQDDRGGVPTEHAVLDVEMTPFLLWMLKERAGLSEVEPYVWRRGAPAAVVVEDPTCEGRDEAPFAAQTQRGVTPVQAGLALASLLLYVIMFQGWMIGLGVFALLFFHELGHVWAMMRAGIRVKGIYFIPFLGAATVPDTLWKDRDTRAYISISGPLWGVLASVPILGIYYATGRRWDALLSFVVLNALLNLVNLIPISPLDGAHVFSSIFYSVSPRLGLVFGAGFLLVALAAAILVGGALLWLLAILGVVFGGFEVLSQYSAALEAEKVRRLGPASDRRWTEEVTRLGDMLSLQTLEEYAWVRTGGAPRRAGKWMRWQQLLSCEAMSGARIALYLGVYFSLAAALVLGLFAARDLPFLRQMSLLFH